MPSAYKEIWSEAYDEARENGLSETECEKVADEAAQNWLEGLYERAKERLRKHVGAVNSRLPKRDA